MSKQKDISWIRPITTFVWFAYLVFVLILNIFNPGGYVPLIVLISLILSVGLILRDGIVWIKRSRTAEKQDQENHKKNH